MFEYNLIQSHVYLSLVDNISMLLWKVYHDQQRIFEADTDIEQNNVNMT